MSRNPSSQSAPIPGGMQLAAALRDVSREIKRSSAVIERLTAVLEGLDWTVVATKRRLDQLTGGDR